MAHRISAGVLVLRDSKVLLVRHHRPGEHDFWIGPGGGVEDGEDLESAAARECLEEAGVNVRVTRLAYIDDGWNPGQRIVKFWFLADYLGGEVDVASNPADDESIVEAGWFARDALPQGHVFPDPVRTRFWDDLASGFPHPIKLPLRQLHF